MLLLNALTHSEFELLTDDEKDLYAHNPNITEHGGVDTEPRCYVKVDQSLATHAEPSRYYAGYSITDAEYSALALEDRVKYQWVDGQGYLLRPKYYRTQSESNLA